MTIRIRTISREERDVLGHWERGDDVVGYRHARVLLLSEKRWGCARIADALGLHVETVRAIIKAFNEGGLDAVTPRPRSGGRPPTYPPEVGEAAEDLTRQEPPPAEGRATWTLHGLARALSARLESARQISHETVRRLLGARDIVWRQAKAWLTSPDPHYALHKAQRDRLLAWARAAPDGAAVWLDQSWFSRWPYRFRAWSSRHPCPHVPQRWNEAVETTALYAALEDESQEAFLRWASGQPNSAETVRFLEALMAHWNGIGKRFIVLLWDRAPWHTSQETRGWVRQYNRRAKREGLTRLILCYLPVRSPWLMPLEAIFGWVKHQVLGPRLFETLEALHGAVEQAFRHRVAEAQPRRACYWEVAGAAAGNSRSVM
jgi:transposase